MDKTERKWTMVVDLDRCTGCAACVVACHAENNVPIVTDREVTRGRGQHWIRIERYWEGEYPDLRARFLPILCMHCDSAPCEPVCPAYATVHSAKENLNLQVYNRCIGTRYCSNNCPYKARFFNFFEPVFDQPENQQLNPDVTVRSAGVMEKCTYCVQRIRRVEQVALAQGRPLRDGEVTPACVQTCPTSALVFGNLYDEDSQVAKLLHHNARRYRLFEHLGTSPALYYLKGGASHVDAGD